MLSCPDCGGNLQYEGYRKYAHREPAQIFRCIKCQAKYEVDEPTELSEVERALVDDALHSARKVKVDDREPWKQVMFPPPRAYPD